MAQNPLGPPPFISQENSFDRWMRLFWQQVSGIDSTVASGNLGGGGGQGMDGEDGEPGFPVPGPAGAQGPVGTTGPPGVFGFGLEDRKSVV